MPGAIMNINRASLCILACMLWFAVWVLACGLLSRLARRYWRSYAIVELDFAVCVAAVGLLVTVALQIFARIASL